ncbi:hypothetical protein GCM10008983_18690 [Lentibacillus halophilus]|uniref:Uncharacterized protein n=1 Tax=Lentibacillus halophilus TaxID=295065 RepID=A0ABN0ZAV8_9BACI
MFILNAILKNIFLGIVTFIIGYIIVWFFSGSKGKIELSYYAAISYSLIFLAAVIVVCTGIIANKLDKLSRPNDKQNK